MTPPDRTAAAQPENPPTLKELVAQATPGPRSSACDLPRSVAALNERLSPKVALAVYEALESVPNFEHALPYGPCNCPRCKGVRMRYHALRLLDGLEEAT